MPTIRMPTETLAGLSFSLSEHILIAACSQAKSLRKVIRLDHGSDTEEFEEVVAFHGNDSRCLWIMWRDASIVSVQPIFGSVEHYN